MIFNINEALQFYQCSQLVKYTNLLYQQEILDDLVGDTNEQLHRCLINQLYQPGHYRTLAYISTLFNNSKFIELGTNYGISALSLSYNNTNNIISYDIRDRNQKLINKNNLKFEIKNILLNQEDMSILLSSNLFFLDIAPHEGLEEQKILNYLITNNYNGILILDDIYYNYEMSQFWNNINIKKYDISICRQGNVGFGIVDFSNNVEII